MHWRQTIPIGAMSLSFMGCSSDLAAIAGQWDAYQLLVDGEDVSDYYLGYTYTYGTYTCTSSAEIGITILRWNAAFIWSNVTYGCEYADPSENFSYSYGYATYVRAERDGDILRLEASDDEEYSLDCQIDVDLRCIQNSDYGDFEIRFRQVEDA